MATRAGSSVDEAADRAVDNIVAKHIARGEGQAIKAADEAFLKSAGIKGGLEETPEVRDETAPASAQSNTPVLDGVDKATNTAWNAQIAIPMLGGIGGFLAKKGKEWGPVFGAVPRGLGYLIGAPQKAMEFEVQDIAHRESAKLNRTAKSHLSSAERFGSKAAGSLGKAEDVLKGDKLAGVRKVVAEHRANVSNLREEAPADIGSHLKDMRDEEMKIFSVSKAKGVDANATRAAFDAAVAEAKAQGLSAKELKAVEKASGHLDNFAEHVSNLHEHVNASEPLHAQAAQVLKEETTRKGQVIASAERRVEGFGNKAEQVVKNSWPLDKARKGVEALFNWNAKNDGVRAKEINDKAVARLDKAIGAIPDDSVNLKGLKKQLVDIKKDFGTVPQTTDPKALKEIADQFAAKESAFAKAAKELKNSGKLSSEEMKALGAARSSFSGKFLGFFGFGKKALSAHTVLEAQGMSKAKAEFTHDLSAGIKGIPTAISELNGHKMMGPALYGVTQAVAVGRGAQVTGTGFSTYKEISADMQGVDKKQVSGFKTGLQLLHLASVPPEMKEARAQFWKSVGPRLLGISGGMVAFHKVMGHGTSGAMQGVAIAAQIASTGLGELVASRNKLLEAYHEVAQAQKKGLDVPKGAIVGLIVHSHKANKLDLEDTRIITVAQQYVDEKMSAANILKEVGSGKFDKRLAAAAAFTPPAFPEAEQAKLREEIKTEAPKMTVADAEMPHLEERAANANAKIQAAEQPVVGNFSAKVAAENRSSRSIPAPAASHAEAIQSQTELQPAGAVR